MLDEANHPLLLSGSHEFTVVLEKLHSGLRHEHVQTTLDRIESNRIVST